MHAESLESSSCRAAGLVLAFLAAVVCSSCGSGNGDGGNGEFCIGSQALTEMSCAEILGDSVSLCEDTEGCRWEDCDGTCGFCEGRPVDCTLLDDDPEVCSRQPSCSVYGGCGTWAECMEVWLLEDGGCAEIPDHLNSTTHLGQEVSYDEICR